MSAFTVNNGHIDVLVNAAAQFEVFTGSAGVFRALGELLWSENYRSVNYRYREGEPVPAYVLHTTEAPLSPVAVAKAANCLEYQSCEHPEWEESEAKVALDLILAAAEARMSAHERVVAPISWAPNHSAPRYRQGAEYDALPWEFHDLDLAVALDSIVALA